MCVLEWEGWLTLQVVSLHYRIEGLVARHTISWRCFKWISFPYMCIWTFRGFPTCNSYQTWGFVTTVDDLPQLYKRLQHMTVDDFREREARVEASRDSHFTIRGILHQIQLFLLGGGDLECIQLPKSVRSDDA